MDPIQLWWTKGEQPSMMDGQERQRDSIRLHRFNYGTVETCSLKIKNQREDKIGRKRKRETCVRHSPVAPTVPPMFHRSYPQLLLTAPGWRRRRHGPAHPAKKNDQPTRQKKKKKGGLSEHRPCFLLLLYWDQITQSTNLNQGHF